MTWSTTSMWLALSAAAAFAGCRGSSGKRQAGDEGGAAATKPAPPPAVTVALRPVADWGQARAAAGDRGAGTDVHLVTFDLAPETPIQVRVPAGTQLDLSPLAAPDPVDPLAPDAYRFMTVPAKGAATGFRFETTTAAEPVKVEMTSAAAGRYHFAIEVGGRSFVDDVEIGERCPPFALGPELVRTLSPESRRAVRALSSELAGRIATFERPDAMLKLVVLLFGDLVAIHELEQAAQAKACGAASLEFVCARSSCRVAQGSSSLDMKRGDSYTIGVGTTVEFLALGPE